MAGIYIHIPYCKQACHYCDFHFSTNLKTRKELISCLIKEIKIQKDFLKSDQIETIYFGGGTPSLMKEPEIALIMETIFRTFKVSKQVEVTLEANPDDLTKKQLEILKKQGINRLSIGIQSFSNPNLQYFNRAHDAAMAYACIENAGLAGFRNISIDLIFGLPGQNLTDFEKDLEEVIKLEAEHISIYGLTIEEKTVFGKWLNSGKLVPIDDEIAAQQFELIMDSLEARGYSQYEISNFAKPGFESKHNSNYWKGVEYLGIGPGAHSFDGSVRQFNISNNNSYINSIKKGILPFESEVLSSVDKYNEYMLTRIRTAEGVDIQKVENKFNFSFANRFENILQQLQANQLLTVNEKLILTKKGRLIADSITEQFMLDKLN